MTRPFDYQQDFANINFREHPERYQVGRGEQGVLMVEPYKSEILPHWRYKNAEVAARSAEEIYALFEEYRRNNDFVGMDMARKFIQMGYTRARRYANHKGGKKYNEKRQVKPLDHDPVKAEAAAVFKTWWDKIRADEDYLQRKKAHQQAWG
ncbi:DUF4385 domain-containing protein [Enterobacter hormaechei]|uniref:DUF4385 domain-containing protein n=1 Tax=Enterobacter sp. TaxID=42895 RepID=UPI001A11FA1E|nr:DUF4385 domain-containing protein [Enterobacter sp.]EGQ5287794.1 DUF4385 domain-containing protein [Enterobacter hormaechei]EHN8892141.1 DUF4385 domain-containing protein [Enterobacter hormaechei]EKS6643263.1 DUF4385 domain-containing protein [Enterobacter hormaechei]MBS6389630.1 DUF4385 domain-containing protein [Enterobacter sp.]